MAKNLPGLPRARTNIDVSELEQANELMRAFQKAKGLPQQDAFDVDAMIAALVDEKQSE